MTVPDSYVELAITLADAARPIVKGYFRADANLQLKADQSPVTAADTEAEDAMRALIEAACPDHGILGEEGEDRNPGADYVWVLDPIDGTKSFATGRASFGTLIGLAYQGKPVLGIIDQAILDERWLGFDGQTTFNGTPAKTRDCASIDAAWLYSTSPYLFEGGDAAAFSALSQAVLHPLFGTDCYGYGLLASGYCDIVCEAMLNPWDFCALAPVVEGAGGGFTDWAGQPITLASDGRVLATGDGNIHAAALNILSA